MFESSFNVLTELPSDDTPGGRIQRRARPLRSLCAD
ncbi:hypothetical protein GGC63_000687 [Paenibacillus sp. OAS669]|nr:hypothetical protein [Paenibacillus sp. OAS669]